MRRPENNRSLTSGGSADVDEARWALVVACRGGFKTRPYMMGDPCQIVAKARYEPAVPASPAARDACGVFLLALLDTRIGAGMRTILTVVHARSELLLPIRRARRLTQMAG